MLYIKKNITKVTKGIIAHGVNCQGKMGFGVAKDIYNKWPIIKKVYMDQWNLGLGTAKKALGTASIPVKVDTELYISNLYTQDKYGYRKRYASCDAIFKAMSQLYNWKEYEGLCIYIPIIGCGLGGLNWDLEVEPIMQKIDNNYNRIIVCKI